MMGHRAVALLRGVNNIGATKRVSMADLRAIVERLGYRDVRTVLNSGNVVFTLTGGARGAAAARIGKALAARLGAAPHVTVLSGKEVATLVRDNPLAGVADNPSRLLVVVPGKPLDRKRLEPLLAKKWKREVLAMGKRVAYLWCAGGIAESALWPAVDRALERSGTARNMATMTKILALIESRKA
jgi:uncharacterized protein (DUF1697 family)